MKSFFINYTKFLQQKLISYDTSGRQSIYFRPESIACEIAFGKDFSLHLASLTSKGRFAPYKTRLFEQLQASIERFDGDPPNMSVTITTPVPASTESAAWQISSRFRSRLQSGRMVTATIPFCFPTTYSTAALYSEANPP